MKTVKKNIKPLPEIVSTYLADNQCPVAATIRLMEGKWKPIILYLVNANVNRFGEMLWQIEGISKKMLTNQLRELEKDGLIHREVFAEVPPRVEYSISKKGRSLQPIIFAMRDWALKNEIVATVDMGN